MIFKKIARSYASGIASWRAATVSASYCLSFNMQASENAS